MNTQHTRARYFEEYLAEAINKDRDSVQQSVDKEAPLEIRPVELLLLAIGLSVIVFAMLL
jgi:hypothetical protein